MCIRDSDVFDTYTRDAVIAFQNLFGLTPDGVVGPETWNKINKIAEIYTDITASGLRQTEQAPGISPVSYTHLLSKENVNQLHSRGIKVNCWTCDDKADADELIEMGVDFITTNILE